MARTFTFRFSHLRNDEVLEWVKYRQPEHKLRVSLYKKGSIDLYDMDDAVRFRLDLDIKCQ